MIVCVGGVVSRHPDLNALKIVLIDDVVLCIYVICLLIHYYRLLNEDLELGTSQTVHNFVNPWKEEAILILELILYHFFKGAVLKEKGLRLEGVHELLPEADAHLAVVLAPKHDNHLFGLLILHDDNAILKIEIDQNVLWGLNPESLQRQLGRLFRIHSLEEIQVLLVSFG